MEDSFFWRDEILPGIQAAFTSVHAGNLGLHAGGDPAAALANRRRLERVMRVEEGSLRFMNQTHSSIAVEADSDSGAGAAAADAMVSQDGHRPLAVLVADCVPVVLAADDGGATAVIHAGRRGIQGGIVASALDLLAACGAGGVTAWIGPSICGGCYEVPADMQREVVEAVPAARSTTRWGTPGLDLPAGVAAQLGGCGVDVRRVPASAPCCTLENRSLFSHRRSAASGRFAGLVWRG